MLRFKNFKIQTKLIVCLGSLLCVVLIGFLLCLRGILSIDVATDEIAENWFPATLNAAQLKCELMNCRRTTLLHILTTDEAKLKEVDESIAAIRGNVAKHISVLSNLVSSEEERVLLEKLKEVLKSYVSEADKVLALSRNGQKALASDLSTGQLHSHFESLQDFVQRECDLNRSGLDASVASSTDISTQSFWLAIVATLVTVALSIVVGIVLVRSISRPLQELNSLAESVSRGDLDVNIKVHSTDEVGQVVASFQLIVSTLNAAVKELGGLVLAAQNGNLEERADAKQFNGAFAKLINGMNATLDAVQLPIDEAVRVLGNVADRDLTCNMIGTYKGDFDTMKSSLNAAIDGLNGALAQVAVGAEQVNSASGQIANGSQTLAQGASQQASALADITSSMNQMNSITKQNSDNAAIGRTLAEQSQASVQRGTEAMARMGNSISKIKESSDATAKIVKTIDDIAFQTNLLALNAAVEAARAGDAGKGFAVVAEEVRNLAQRSAAAAKTTADLIEESVRNSEGGVVITAEMSKILKEVSEGSRKVNDLIAEIAESSKEQAHGIGEVNQAISNLDKLTQESAANSEESASAGEELNAQASSLANTVAAFKLTAARNTLPTPTAKTPVDLPPKTHPTDIDLVPRIPSADSKNASFKNGRTAKGEQKKVLVPLDDDDFRGF